MYKNILAIMVTMICSNLAFSEQITACKLLEKYKLNHGRLKTHITKSEQLIEFIDTASTKPQWSREFYELRADDERVDLIISQHLQLENPKSETLPGYSYTKRVIWDGNSWIEYYDTKIAPFAVITHTQQKKERFLPLGYGGSPLEGVFFGDLQPVEAILDKASQITLRSNTDNINGVNCHVLDAITPNGEYSLWIDPDHGYNIAKAKVHKAKGDTLYGKPVGFVPEENPDYEVKGDRPGASEEFFFSIDNVKFQKINDIWIPIEANYQYVTKYQGGRVMTEKKYHKRTHIDPNPDFEAVGAFVPNIPNGTKVVLEEAPGMEYRWQDGKMVTDIDKRFIEQLDKMTDEISPDTKAPPTVRTEASAEGKIKTTQIAKKKIDISNNKSSSPAKPQADNSTSDLETGLKSSSSLKPLLSVVFLLVVVATGYIIFLHIRRKA